LHDFAGRAGGDEALDHASFGAEHDFDRQPDVDAGGRAVDDAGGLADGVADQYSEHDRGPDSGHDAGGDADGDAARRFGDVDVRQVHLAAPDGADFEAAPRAHDAPAHS